MKAKTFVLLIACLALVLSVASCRTIPSPKGAPKEPVRVQQDSGLYKSVLYKNTLGRTGTGYANVEHEAESQWW